jgi:hypothetical protein
MSGSSRSRFFGWIDGVTVRRWSRCSGGSIAMNVRIRSCASGSFATGMPSVMPSADENVASRPRRS